MRVRTPACVALAVALNLFTAGAQANDFAPDGTFLFDPDAALSDGFEDHEASEGYEVVEAADALEGTHILSCDTENQAVGFLLDAPEEPTVYEATLWIRGEGFAAVVVLYDDKTLGDFTQLFPTGRMTSDGWMEMRTVAFPVAGDLGAKLQLFFFGDLQADALEIHPSDAIEFHPPTRCAGLSDTVCPGESICVDGFCRDPSGWVPPLPEDQEAMSAYLENRLRFFFGPHLNRERYFDDALADTADMPDASSRWAFWNGFATAVRRLRDSHTHASTLDSYLIGSYRVLNACFTPGEGDLSQTIAPSDPELPDVLVAYVGDTYPWGFSAGDRLVAVDGQHPIRWMQSLITHDWGFRPADDPTSLAWYAERLRTNIPRYATTVTVIHCSAGACSEPETKNVADMPEVDPDEDVEVIGCDHRPQPLVPNQPTNHSQGYYASVGQVLGTDASEKIYGLVWDMLFPGTPADALIKSAVATWRTDAQGVIIDHRRGDGGGGPQGGTSIADPILAFVRPPSLFGVKIFRKAADEQGPQTTAEGLDLVAAYENTPMAWKGGSDDARTDVPVALLITRDVSFSDMFPYAFAGGENVRLFGPNPTNGAFSSFFSLSYWFGMNYQVGSDDVIGADGIPLCGRGVAPSEVVLPRQSDLLAGVDTVAARAVAWIREEVQP